MTRRQPRLECARHRREPAYRIERTWETRGTDAAAVVASGSITTWSAPAVKRFVRRELVTYREGRIRDKSVEVVTAFTVGPPPATAATSTRESL